MSVPIYADEKVLDASRPRCYHCKEIGSINHTLTVTVEVDGVWEWFNETCFLASGRKHA